MLPFFSCHRALCYFLCAAYQRKKRPNVMSISLPSSNFEASSSSGKLNKFHFPSFSKKKKRFCVVVRQQIFVSVFFSKSHKTSIAYSSHLSLSFTSLYSLFTHSRSLEGNFILETRTRKKGSIYMNYSRWLSRVRQAKNITSLICH